MKNFFPFNLLLLMRSTDLGRCLISFPRVPTHCPSKISPDIVSIELISDENEEQIQSDLLNSSNQPRN